MTRPATRYSGPIPSTLNPTRAHNAAALTQPNDDTFTQAACLGFPEWMFPEGHAAERRRQEQRAKDLCGRCLIRETCALTALTRDERWGVYGGINMEDPVERRNARRRYGLPPVNTTTPTACGDRRGTTAGYRRHQVTPEKPCDECRIAFNDYNTARRARARRAAQAVNATSSTEARQWFDALVELAGPDGAERILTKITKEAS